MIKIKTKNLYWSIFAMIFLIALFEPRMFEEDKYEFLDLIFTILKILVSVVTIFLAWYLKIKININELMFAILITGVSTIYNNSSFSEYIRSYVYIIVTLIFLGVGMSLSTTSTISAIGQVFCFFNIINTITVILFPDGMYRSNIGFTKNWFLGYKNVATPLVITGLVCLVYDSVCRKKRISLYVIINIAISILYMIMSGSSTGILAIITLLVFSLITAKQKKINAKVLTLFCIILYLIIIFVRIENVLPFLGNLFGLFGKGFTFSGRTKLWDFLITDLNEYIITGNGCLTSKEYIQRTGIWWAVHTHSYYLQMLYEGGIISELLFFLFLERCSSTFDRTHSCKESGIIFWGFIAFLVAFQMECYAYVSAFYILTYLMLNIGKIEYEYLKFK